MIKRVVLSLIIASCLLLSGSFGVACAFDDGFGQAKKIEGKHFIIYYAPQVDISGVTQKLNVGFTDKILSSAPSSSATSSERELAGMLDTLFVRICNILDMNLYSFQGTIKICRDSGHLNSIYRNLFDTDLESSSFYTYSLNTIYISPEAFRPEVVGHEIAHAIISHYFVVQTPVKVAEVLSGYVEYQLRKTPHR